VQAISLPFFNKKESLQQIPTCKYTPRNNISSYLDIIQLIFLAAKWVLGCSKLTNLIFMYV